MEKKIMDVEVTITSRENIKPSLSTLDHLKHYKLCLFDQLTPVTYSSGVIFYPITQPNLNLPKTLAHLKNSLSKVLNLYYPCSGRTKNNLYIDDFSTGLLYLEARVERRMSDFFKLRDIESLNRFIPLHPYRKETDTSGPQVAIQVNIFACGGIGLGVSLDHKFSDGATAALLLKSWAAEFSGSPEKIIQPNLSGASMTFPARKDLPKKHVDMMDEMWFYKENDYVTKRFVFDSRAITALRAKAKSEKVPKPTRNEALTGFIWKHATAASWAISGSPKISIAAHAVNLRSRMKTTDNDLTNSTGNLFWYAFAAADPANEAQRELHQLVGMLKDVLESFDNDFLEMMKGEDGFSAVSELLNQIEALFSMDSVKPDIFAFTAWNGLFNDIDFGWGMPYWIGVMGKVGPVFRNFVVFLDSKWGKGIEAWITLEKKQMKVLENDKEFLAFASLNPGISSL